LTTFVKMTWAPIALFVYNRPDYTHRTVEALAKNAFANESILHIFSDGAKTSIDTLSVQKVRSYLKGIIGFKKVVVVEQTQNLGLAASIINGVTSLCKRYGRVIVLEDDLVTSPHFLTFMNSSLRYYENTTEVMHISGFRYPVEPFETDDTFFLNVPLCWGWATWDRAWKYFDKNISIMGRFNRQKISRFDFNNNYAFWKQLELNKSGRLDTWFIFWYVTLFLRGGLALFPARSLVQNIGLDGIGTHSGITDDYNVVLSETPINLAKIPLDESAKGFIFHRRYFRKIKVGLIKRIIRKLRFLIIKICT
jgi:hypothetical protein